jgi:hypothetical protein
VLAFLLSAIEEYSEAPDIPEGSGASSISDSAMVLPVRWTSTAIVHGSSRPIPRRARAAGSGAGHSAFLLRGSDALGRAAGSPCPGGFAVLGWRRKRKVQAAS